MEYIIRKMKPNEYHLLDEFLYNAIFVPQGVTPLPKSIIEKDDLQVYVKGFGKRKDDVAFVAEVDGKIVGAVWARIMNDYWHIDDETPSLAISVYNQYRGNGIGTALMVNMLSQLRHQCYKRVSLAVQKDNYAVRMYKKLGFEIFDENSQEYIMLLKL